jgi:uncharacterized membrane protein YdjX (TVP38/TMEM64 family)
MFQEMKEYLIDHGVKTVMVACPNCHKVFSRYGEGLTTRTIYEALAESNGIERSFSNNSGETVAIHNPCAVRFEEAIHKSVRHLVETSGRLVEERPHSGRYTICCGEGGAVGAINPHFVRHWGNLHEKENQGHKTVTYCAGCVSMLSHLGPCEHILDTLWNHEDSKAKVAKPPFTYCKRLRLKKWFKSHVAVTAQRERAFTVTNNKKGSVVKLIIFLLFLAVVIIAVKTSGVSQIMDQQTLRTWIAGYGSLAPIIYMCVYTIAPALFLPGLPITLVGGVVFGPFWGVVYTIIGSTAGACSAFLVSRYLAREWVAGQLVSPRWKRLDEGVEKHGWKVVAFTRLVPLFPFNLLNYAFGLTKIGFRDYTAATFLCMLPACIAFVVFSSSLLDVIRGKVSLAFIFGIALIVLVSLFPLLYRRYKAKKGEEEPL